MEFVVNLDVWFEANDQEAADSIINRILTILHNEKEVTGIAAGRLEEL